MTIHFVRPSKKLFRLLLKNRMHAEAGCARELFISNGDCKNFYYHDWCCVSKFISIAIAVKERKIIGWCFVFKSNSAELRDAIWCYVTPCERRKHYGTKLVEATVNRLGRNNFRCDNSHTIREAFWSASLTQGKDYVSS